MKNAEKLHDLFALFFFFFQSCAGKVSVLDWSVKAGQFSEEENWNKLNK